MTKCNVKADDFRAIPSERWRRFVDACLAVDLPASLGFIAGAVSAGAVVDATLVRAICDGPFEIWNHGLAHKYDQASGIAEFCGPTLEQQLGTLIKSQTIAQEVFSRRPRVFGPPFNRFDVNTLRALEALPELEGAYDLPAARGLRTLPKAFFVDFEGPGTGRRFSLERARSQTERFMRFDSPFVLQIHPGNHWTASCVDEFICYVEEVRQRGYEFVLFDDLFSP